MYVSEDYIDIVMHHPAETLALLDSFEGNTKLVDAFNAMSPDERQNVTLRKCEEKIRELEQQKTRLSETEK